MGVALHSYIKRPHAAATSWTVPAVCAAYGFPTGLSGGGKIAIVELGGGWIQSDVTTFFNRFTLPIPNITDISVDGAANNGDPTDPASGEVMLDIQVAASVYAYMTGMPANIGMFWAENSNVNGIADTVLKAASMGYDVFSCSWGADEADWGRIALTALESASLKAATARMTCLAAAGDNDSSDGGIGAANVDSPASCPHFIGCGGTNKPVSGLETVWNNNPGNADGEGTGGGYSTYWGMPIWQINGGAPHNHHRMVPDVAGNADPTTGYDIYLDGQWQVFGGTSAVAPLWSGFIAASGTKKGFLNAKLWAKVNRNCFNTHIDGNNGPGAAHSQPPCPGPCTGLGSPVGASLAKLLEHRV